MEMFRIGMAIVSLVVIAFGISRCRLLDRIQQRRQIVFWLLWVILAGCVFITCLCGRTVMRLPTVTRVAVIGAAFAFGSALWESVVDVSRKTTTAHFKDTLLSVFTLHALTLLLALPVTILVSFQMIPVPAVMSFLVRPFPVSSAFWISLAISVSLNSVAVYVLMDVLAHAELGIALPLTTLSPVFMLMTSPIVLHEFPSVVGLVGIVITTLGAYGLNFQERSRGLLKPLLTLWQSRNNRKMLFIAAMWSITSVFDKKAVLAGGPLWYATWLDFGLAAIYFCFMFRDRRWSTLRRDGSTALLPLGISNAFRLWSQCLAVSLIPAVYAISVKRLSTVFGVLWGRSLFQEKETLQRTIAALIMLVGTFFILSAL